MIWVELTPAEMMQAAQCGAMRCIHSINKGEAPADGCKPEDVFKVHIHGAMGEVAAARAMGRYWPASVGVYRNGDDVRGIQVRAVKKHDWDLPIRPRDKQDAAFVLVTGLPPKLAVHGWIMASDARQTGCWTDHGNGRPPIWYVAQADLLPLETCPGGMI